MDRSGLTAPKRLGLGRGAVALGVGHDQHVAVGDVREPVLADDLDGFAGEPDPELVGDRREADRPLRGDLPGCDRGRGRGVRGCCFQLDVCRDGAGKAEPLPRRDHPDALMGPVVVVGPDPVVELARRVVDRLEDLPGEERFARRPRCCSRDHQGRDAEPRVVIDPGDDLRLCPIREADPAHDVHLPTAPSPGSVPTVAHVVRLRPPPIGFTEDGSDPSFTDGGQALIEDTVLELVEAHPGRVSILDDRRWFESSGLAHDRSARPDAIHLTDALAEQVAADDLGPTLRGVVLGTPPQGS